MKIFVRLAKGADIGGSAVHDILVWWSLDIRLPLVRSASRLAVTAMSPPRSPKLHGAVERANRTHTEEFYEVTDEPAELAPLQAGLPGLGNVLRHGPPPPGAGLPHSRRMARFPGLPAGPGVTDVPDPYTVLTCCVSSRTI